MGVPHRTPPLYARFLFHEDVQDRTLQYRDLG